LTAKGKSKRKTGHTGAKVSKRASDGKALDGLVLDSITEGVITMDAECRITSFNRAAEEITGYAREDASGKLCRDLLRADLCDSLCPMLKTLDDGLPISNVRVNIRTRDDLRLPISVNTSVLRDTTGNVIGGVLLFRSLASIEELRDQLLGTQTFQRLVSRNAEMREMFRLLPDVAQSECTVLIQGPSGSGKELVARAIHNLSPRSHGPFVVINCAALPETLLESELFGYKRGAFTDAHRDKPGRFVLAKGGTLLLDEIGDMPMPLQVKLLRVLQDGEIQPLGSTETQMVDVRILAATNQDLKGMISRAAFREDLYYRVNVINIEIPPLSRRRDDIQPLVEHFIRRLNVKTHKNIKVASDEVLERLMAYEFPGNVRELVNAIEHAFVLCKEDSIQLHHLPKYLSVTVPQKAIEKGRARYMDTSEETLLRKMLEQHDGNKGVVADELGIHRTTLWRKLKKYNLA